MENEQRQDEAQTTATDAGQTDYKALYEAAQADAEKWKAQARKQESRAKSNADAAQQLDTTTAALAEISERLKAVEEERAALKAAADRAELVSKVSQATGVPQSIVSTLAANDEEGLTAAAQGIAQAYAPKGGAPNVSEAGKFANNNGGMSKADILAIKDSRERIKAIQDNIDLFK